MNLLATMGLLAFLILSATMGTVDANEASSRIQRRLRGIIGLGTRRSACCSNSSRGYATCITEDRCSRSKRRCARKCEGTWLAVPIIRDGCCSFEEEDCSSVDPASEDECQYLASDCNSCGGVWRPLTVSTQNPTPPPTNKPTNLPTEKEVSVAMQTILLFIDSI
eukprot:scaffold6213_cov186-Alexandrium_tamarense.AAC.1